MQRSRTGRSCRISVCMKLGAAVHQNLLAGLLFQRGDGVSDIPLISVAFRSQQGMSREAGAGAYDAAPQTGGGRMFRPALFPRSGACGGGALDGVLGGGPPVPDRGFGLGQAFEELAASGCSPASVSATSRPTAAVDVRSPAAARACRQ
jgi:hypothetical protein